MNYPDWLTETWKVERLVSKQRSWKIVKTCLVLFWTNISFVKKLESCQRKRKWDEKKKEETGRKKSKGWKSWGKLGGLIKGRKKTVEAFSEEVSHLHDQFALLYLNICLFFFFHNFIMIPHWLQKSHLLPVKIGSLIDLFFKITIVFLEYNLSWTLKDRKIGES